MSGPMELWTMIRAEYMAVGMSDWQFALCAVAGLAWGWWDGRLAKAKKREANRRWWARWHLGVKTAFLVKQDRDARAEEARLL